MKCERLILALVLGFTFYGAQADDLPGTGAASEPASSGWLGGGKSSKAARPADKAAADKSSTPDKTSVADSGGNEPNPVQPAQQLLLQAMSLIGVKYKWGGKTPESGLDCSGFVRYVFQNSLNITLPHNALAMSQSGKDIDRTELKPGDLVFFNTLRRRFSHVGIYLGDNRFVHSPRTGRDIEVANMNESYWTTRFDGARRVADMSGEAPTLASLLAVAGTSRSSNQAESSAAAGIEPQAGGGSCRKVTRGKGKHKHVETVCGKPKEGKATTATAKAGKTGNKAVSKKPVRSTRKKAN
ncbi:cell wall-associated NlpC family hydrolase [Silvimonas terrae]|uniref:Cell wall-associated NlpC family hydrolase n=1 Tax=Silvimonas terrae TaxID=300266 RepID=A0A840RD90_9NEIS|nr:C40 family peptidase [Silvimonas terrae]MBB5190554.1 cell wall-associated NlpC family hydrolase [Silvimonas terrae]